MTGSSHIPLNIDATTTMVAVVTVVTVLVVSLTTLARPSRATVTWGVAFGLGMMGAYLWLAGFQLDDAGLRGAASGILLGFEALVWLGLRLFARRPARWRPAVAFVVLCPAALVLSAGTPVYPIAFRVLFLAASVFAGLIAYELFRLQGVPRDITMPLMLASGVFVVLAVAASVSVFLVSSLDGDEQIAVIRGINTVGTLVTSVCAAFTLVLLVRAEAPGRMSDDDALARIARRLQRADAQNDTAWSLLDVRLDDPDDLREASSSAAFGMLSARFHDDVEASLPAAADVEHLGDDRSLVLLAGGEEAVRHYLRAMLGRISAIDRDEQAPRIRVSASVGWASTSAFGYDVHVLVDAAALAAVRARAGGGDRWARAVSTASPTTLEE